MGSDFEQQRQQMVHEQIEGRGIRDTAVLQAMATIPREQFVLSDFKEHAYKDSPLPIYADQTISQPYVVGFMLAALDLKPTDKILEIGTGSGYAAALLGHIVATVHTVERHEKLVAYARERLQALNITNVHVHHADGTMGWPPAAPYDGIVVAAGSPHIPPTLKKQLKMNGRLVIPIGKRRNQRLIFLVRTGENQYRQTNLGGVKFVPLIGAEAWSK